MLGRTAGQTPNGMRTVLHMTGASVGIASIGIVDAKVPGDLDATALYLGLVAVIAWRTLAAVGIVTAIAAALTAISVDLAASPTNFASVAIWNGGAGLAIFLGVALLVRKLRVERDALRAAATHDGLTGLPNRVLLYDRLEQALLAAAREKFSVGVLVFDLDGFKRVNDTLGHHAGDQLLRLVGSRARSCVRASDTCARIGGDEFVVLLARTSPGGAARVAEVLARSCAQPFLVDGAPVSVAASIGTAVAPEDGADPDTLLRLADARMYQAKSLARNGVATEGGLADLASR
jgi:diguanylate cyclase (GGDEF)-like protein